MMDAAYCMQLKGRLKGTGVRSVVFIRSTSMPFLTSDIGAFGIPIHIKAYLDTSLGTLCHPRTPLT